MEDGVELSVGKERAERVALVRVLLEKMKPVRSFQVRDVAAAAEMQVVDAPHLVALGAQAIAQMTADEAGTAGHERAHGSPLVIGQGPAARTGNRARRGRS